MPEAVVVRRLLLDGSEIAALIGVVVVAAAAVIWLVATAALLGKMVFGLGGEILLTIVPVIEPVGLARVVVWTSPTARTISVTPRTTEVGFRIVRFPLACTNCTLVGDSSEVGCCGNSCCCRRPEFTATCSGV